MGKKKMNLEQFVEAQKSFDFLRAKAVQCGERGKVPVPPHQAELNFGTPTYVVALLYSRGKERLQELE